MEYVWLASELSSVTQFLSGCFACKSGKIRFQSSVQNSAVICYCRYRKAFETWRSRKLILRKGGCCIKPLLAREMVKLHKRLFFWPVLPRLHKPAEVPLLKAAWRRARGRAVLEVQRVPSAGLPARLGALPSRWLRGDHWAPWQCTGEIDRLIQADLMALSWITDVLRILPQRRQERAGRGSSPSSAPALGDMDKSRSLQFCSWRGA